jgi:nucleotide-binding universal stress UspA family protein
MRKILLAVDDTQGSVHAADVLVDLFSAVKTASVVLVYVEKMLGRSIVGEALESEPEMQEMREALKGTPYQERLDQRGKRIITFYEKKLADAGISNVASVVREGHPAEEILATAEEHDADLIVVGSRGGRQHRFLLGSVSREVANSSHRPVLIARR